MSLLKYDIAKKHLTKQHHRLMFLSVLAFISWITSFSLTSTIYSLSSVNMTTSVTVSNTAPSFSVSPFESPASTGTSPINVGTNLTFGATATDPNNDQYYLAICRTNVITPVTNGAPTCASSQTLCISGATNSGSSASCIRTALLGDTEIDAWFGFVCDHSSGSACSSASQGTGDSGSPFNVNHNPLFTSMTVGSAVDPGQNITFNAVAQDNDTDTTQDSVHLIVCSSAGATSSGCNTPGDLLCNTGNVTNDPSCSYTTPSVFSAGSHNYYSYIFDQHGLGASSNTRSGTYIINNLSPSVSNLSINGGSAINLNVSTTTAVHFTFTITDYNGYADVNSLSTKLYRTGVGVGAVDNTNNHYTVTSCTSSNQAGASADYNCTFNVQYHADPTDVVGTQYYTDDWTSTVTATDQGSLQATSSATAVELNSLLGITATSSINYGALTQGGNTGSTNQEVMVESVGNTGLDTLLQGTDMDDGNGHIIAATYQKYFNTTFTYGTGGTSLTNSDVLLALRVTKTTISGTPSNKKIYWGIEIPAAIPSGNYAGTNTITGQVNDPLYW
jgi:hypothetical protein